MHVAGLHRFLQLAESSGWETIFLGPAVPVETLVEFAEKEKADLIAVSYRLTPETGERLLGDFAEAADTLQERGCQIRFRRNTSIGRAGPGRWAYSMWFTKVVKIRKKF